MTMTCDACRMPFEAAEDRSDSVTCPWCERVNRPRGRVETVEPMPMPSENTGDHDDVPMKTMMFPADGDLRDTGVTDVKHLRKTAKSGLKGAAFRLTVMEQGQSPRDYRIEKPRLIVGRGKCDVKLRDPEVSRQHCAIEVYDGVATVKDLQSANGTVLNGHLVTEHVLKPGDRIRVGTTEMTVVQDKAA